MSGIDLIVGILQRSLPLHLNTLAALSDLQLETIVVDSSPHSPSVRSSPTIRVIHEPDADGYFAILLLKSLLREFLETTASRLLLIEGDMVLSSTVIEVALGCETNTKAFYQESDPNSPYAYVRCEGMAGLIFRSEVRRIYEWMCMQDPNRFRQFEGYHDSFLWFSINDESNKMFPVLHMTHDDSTRVTKRQRLSNKNLYRIRQASTTAMAIECRKHILTMSDDSLT